MSCSDEYVSHATENNLIQITPRMKTKLQKAKYGVYNHSSVELCHWTKNLLPIKVTAISTSSTEFPPTDVWK